MCVAACGGKKPVLPAGTADADKFLFDRGTEAAQNKKWLNAREYFRNLVDNYPQSTVSPGCEARARRHLHLREIDRVAAAWGAGVSRVPDLLSNAPARRLRATAAGPVATPSRCSSRSAISRRPRTRIKEIEIFLQRYPNSKLMPEARKLEREARDRLSEANYRVGFYYFRVKWYVGAIDRFKDVLDTDPGFTLRDAVYYHLAESLYRTDKKAEALPYYERLIREFEKSEYLELAQKRVAELKGGTTAGK